MRAVMPPVTKRIHNVPNAPLAQGLKRITLGLVISVVVLGAAIAMLAHQMTQQIGRLNAKTDLEASRNELLPSLDATQVLLTPKTAEQISAILTLIKSQLDTFGRLDPENALAEEAEANARQMLDLIANMQQTSSVARLHIQTVQMRLDEFVSESIFWRQRVNQVRHDSSFQLTETEEAQRRHSQDIATLAASIFAATNLVREVEGAIRYSVTSSAELVPLTKVTLSRRTLPSPCGTQSDDVEEQACTPSRDRVHSAIESLLSADPDRIPTLLDRTHRALTSYVRSGKRQFNNASQQLTGSTEQANLLRKQYEGADQNFNRLNFLNSVLEETNAEIDRLAAGELYNLAGANFNLQRKFTQIHNDISRTAKDFAAGDFISTQLEQTFNDLLQSWINAYTALLLYSEQRTNLETQKNSLNAGLERMMAETRSEANQTFGLMSTLAIAGIILMAALAAALYWGGRSFVTRPLEKTTQTILALADGAPIGPVQFSQRSMGLGTLEDALERLRKSNIERAALTQKNIEQRVQIEQTLEDLAEKTREMAYLARHDPLTDLGNRRGADDLLASFDPGHSATRQDFTLLHVDIDSFKEINDTLGHDAGDAVLVHVAETLKSLIGSDDQAFRIGGDEFLIVRSTIHDNQSSHMLAEKIILELNNPVDYRGHACRIGASIGIAHANNDHTGRDALMNADIALYEAKSGGRNQFVEFSKSLQEKTISRKTLADRLLIAMENDEFVPYFQPQFFSDTLELRGLETLCRWHHPELGVLSPAHFMEQAEASTLVGAIDQILLEKAAADLEKLQTRGHTIPKISFNVTADRLMHADFATSLVTKFNDDMEIGIELLESMSLDNLSESVRWAIDNLKDHGVSIEIDDFGSCRASIAGLIAVGPDAMKIDGAIVGPITESTQHLHLVRAIIDIGNALGIEVIAERVETEKHIEILRAHGCNILQGYALAKPMHADNLADFLDAHQTQQLRSA